MVNYYESGAQCAYPTYGSTADANQQDGAFAVQSPHYSSDQTGPADMSRDMYWAPPAAQPKSGYFVQGQRKRLSLVGMLVSLFVPWILFLVVFAVMSFSLHYTQPVSTYLIIVMCLLVPITYGLFVLDHANKKQQQDPRLEPTWYMFGLVATMIAWFAGVMAGDINYFRNMMPYYDIMNLNVYPQVNPAELHGQQLMDAGRVIFTKESKLDIDKSMGFRNMDLYCVAPVTVSSQNGTLTSLDNYDFWAVGKDCCSGENGNFHCGEFNNPRAHGGLRLMRDRERGFYRLAVQQAEAAYNIKASHPLFFHWMQDPVGEVATLADTGSTWYLIGVFAHFVFQMFLVASASMAYGKMGYM